MRKALGLEIYLRNELIVGSPHGHGPKERLEVVGDLAPSAVVLTCWIQRDEDSRIEVDVNVSS